MCRFLNKIEWLHLREMTFDRDTKISLKHVVWLKLQLIEN